jgi:hypothetical protein
MTQKTIRIVFRKFNKREGGEAIAQFRPVAPPR